MKGLRLCVAGVLLVLLGAGTLWLWPELQQPAVEPTAPSLDDPALISSGRYLVTAGNCMACHTQAGEPAYSGGRAVPTPFGAVYSSNLTPDLQTGLGGWSAADFYRALHHGRSRDGRRLAPAFPYDHYTRISRADSDAMFAYLRSLPPVSRAQPVAELRWPYGTQAALLVWRRLYFRPQAFAAQPQQSAAWNRGAYLVEGLGHCGACHTPRSALGGLRGDAALAGAQVLGWDAPGLRLGGLDDAAAARQAELLRAGSSADAVITGPMAEVVFHSLQHLRADDVAAMVDYLRSLPALPTRAPRVPRVSDASRKQMMTVGAQVYREHCTSCHGDDGRGQPPRYPPLAGNESVTAASARNAIRSLLYGGYAPSTQAQPRPYGMPPFRHQLDDEQLASVLSYVRNHWGNAAPPVSVVELQRY